MLPVRGKSAAYLNIESNYYINATISISSDPSDALFRQTYALSIDAIRSFAHITASSQEDRTSMLPFASA